MRQGTAFLTFANVNPPESTMEGFSMRTRSQLQTLWGWEHYGSACLAASGPGQLIIIDGAIDSENYQQILRRNVRTCDTHTDSILG